MDNDTKLMIAIFLDIFGLICAITVVGEVLSFVPDVIGFAFLGVNKKQAKGFYLSFVGELIPFVGAAPFWTFYVMSEIKAEERAEVNA